MRLKKRVVIPTVFVILAGVFALLIYRAELTLKSPGALSAIEHRIERAIGGEISIGTISIEPKEGSLVTLTEVSATAGGIHLTAETVRLTLSPWALWSGRVEIRTVHLDTPHLTLPETFKPKKARSPLPAFPKIVVQNGSATLPFQGRALSFEDVTGQITAKAVSLSCTFIGAAAGVRVEPAASGWQAKAWLKGFPLSRIDKKIRGTADLSLAITGEGNGGTASVSVTTDGFDFPGLNGELRKLDIGLETRYEGKRFLFTGIRARTPLITFTGSGKLLPGEGNSLGQSLLDLNLSSSVFNYEKVAAKLPSAHFPEWLSTLLYTQIRDGNARFSTIEYKGKAADLLTPSGFVDNTLIALEAMGLSFGSSFHPFRATGITAKVMLKNGGIEVRDLSGTMGASAIRHVEILFPEILGPEFRLVVAADLDMAAKDFLSTWRAVLEPMYIEALLGKVTDVSAGRISGKALFEQRGFTKDGMRITGNVRLSDASFKWGERTLANVAGSALSAEPGGPVTVSATGIFDDFPVDNLTLTINDIFGQLSYRFLLLSDRLPEIRYPELSQNAVVRLSGSGIGPAVSGDLSIRTEGFALPGERFRSTASEINAAGEFSAVLAPELSMEVEGMTVRVGERSARLDVEATGSRCRLSLSGELDLVRTDPAGTEVPFSGGIDLSAAWDETTPLAGKVLFHGFTTFPGEGKVILDGPAVISGDTLRAKAFRLRYRDLDLRLSGTFRAGPTPHYSGEIELSGLTIDRGEQGAISLPRELSADARLKIPAMHFYELPVTDGAADLKLADGNLLISNMAMAIPNGSISGDLILEEGKAPDVDLSISLSQAELSAYLGALTGEKASVSGSMDLTGRLTGSLDRIGGELNFRAEDGKIRKYSLLSKIFGALNVYKILKSGGGDLSRKGFPYNTITATFKLDEGVMRFDDFAMDSNSLPVSAVGEYHLAGDHLDAVMAAQPLETVDRAIGFLPVLGWILTGDDNRLFIVSLSIKGDPDDPSVTLLPVDTLSKPVTDTLLRILKLPGEIITDPKQLVPGMKKSKKE